MTERLRVNKLHRMDPSPRQDGYWYYSPMGYCIGPFSTHEEREADIVKHYEEVEHFNLLLEDE